MSSTSSTIESSWRRPSSDMCDPTNIVFIGLPLHLETSNLLDSPDSDKTDKMEMEETNSAKRLRTEDPMRAHYDGIGVKRRASMGPDNSVPLAFTIPSDSLRRRDRSQKVSPASQPSVIPQESWSHSLDSHLPTESIVSIGLSYGQIPPGELPPGAISSGGIDDICISPHNGLMSLNASPRGSFSDVTYQRTISENGPLASSRKLTEVSKPDEHKIFEGFFMCDCCPKKPKKFQSAGDLASHEAEKHHKCSFCESRFKNKNEAERHQNSLHIRQKSWSCLALNAYDRAFHKSINRPGAADFCGYCGEDFPRNGSDSGDSASRRITGQEWEERVRHLEEVYKFRECNKSKTFFRADHFRQHLRHSHVGTNARWTNVLENACMLDENTTPR
ncbi:hypothetical protein CABS01_16489 [Colletotrichum abscissum]|uniref:C2H2-type domain-containing protein n=1 Tax=Colletotrichum abscissum TaxID=1671311 RepID=A0A9P9X3E5_9PEZI|nr:uncharacterized protein CABS01_16489 [Colletotrichum abscissum]KAI3534616.1 hypothetical protein CABS02_13197 [Colletotrichum abscissum]KAK1521608.1 hypothetical protein CABS01_16489 [Colletotrichum abscissum]